MNTSVDICGIKLKNPVTTASGTFGFGRELNEFFPIGEIGAISVKGLTLKKRAGNVSPRICETPSGIMNSVGLQNPGIEVFLKEDLPFLKSVGATVIANINGSTIDEYIELAEITAKSDIDLIELNISCPNVKCGGAAFGQNEEVVAEITRRVKDVSAKKPLIVKLSPNVTDIRVMALAAEQNGADALSLINTVMGMKIDLKTRKPFFENKVAGLSGAAVHPIAVRMVYQVRTVTDLPIIGMGGIMCAEDAIELMMAGANAIAVGTASLIDPYAAYNIKNGIEKYMQENNISDINQVVNAAHK
ncbi:MAG: dihydroorotate dehydrogenase [Clostridiales bacterium]|nr:MAG: dihydroorotate dehydrogenase [Clostridiales bacterium]